MKFIKKFKKINILLLTSIFINSTLIFSSDFTDAPKQNSSDNQSERKDGFHKVEQKNEQNTLSTNKNSNIKKTDHTKTIAAIVFLFVLTTPLLKKLMENSLEGISSLIEYFSKKIISPKPKKNNYKDLVILSSVILTVATIILIILYNKNNGPKGNRNLDNNYNDMPWPMAQQNIAQEEEEEEYHSPYTTFHEAVLKDGWHKDIEYLIKRRANIEEKNEEGNTPLAVACKLKRLAMTRLLLDNGANINATNNAGETPLKIMQANADKEIEIEMFRPKRSYYTRFGYEIDYSIPYTEPKTDWINLFKIQNKINSEIIKNDPRYAYLFSQMRNQY